MHPPTIYYDPAVSGLSGHAGWVSSVLFPIFDENKKVVAVVHANQDVTDQKKLEQEMLDKIRQLEVFYNASVGRELKIVELKEKMEIMNNELQDLKDKLSK